MSSSVVTEEMRAIVGKVLRESLSFPISASDIRKWAMSVYYPEVPPRLYWDAAYAAATVHGGIVAPEEFNPFAWMAQMPALTNPPTPQTGFSERELGVEPPKYTAMLLTDMRASYGGVRMRPGDVIRSVYRITDYFEREGRMGHMLYTTVSNELANQHGEWIRTIHYVFARY